MTLVCNVAVVVVLLVTLSVLPATDAAAKCEVGDNGQKCTSCARKGTCEGVTPGGDVVLLEACPEGKACVMDSGLAVCKPVEETDCNCGGKTVGCDIYDLQRINICLPNRRPIPAEYCDKTQVCSDAKCLGPKADACKTEPDLSFVLSTPDCASSALCYKKEVVAVEWCGPGQFFNVESEECEVYSPDPCANCAESMCPILSDCTKYAACSNGQLVSVETCASSGTKFDFGLQKCTTVTPLDNPCAFYEDCDFDLIAASNTQTTITTPTTTTTTTTTTTPSTPSQPTPPTTPTTQATPTTPKPATCTAANAGQRYPHETDCKKYYNCRSTTRNTYVYIEAPCSGTYVFNPVIRLCDDPINVPGCNP